MSDEEAQSETKAHASEVMVRPRAAHTGDGARAAVGDGVARAAAGEGPAARPAIAAAGPDADEEEEAAASEAEAGRWIGARVDHFDIQEPLGRGGMGVVYLARDLSLDRPVALKVLRGSLAGKVKLEDRFTREARAQARLKSPYVVHIYYIGHAAAGEGRKASLYFAMEHVDGESLEAILERKQRLDAETARRLMIEVAEGLRAAREAGIIHRDIKPSNILRGKDGHVKIADFGLAKPLSDNTKITEMGMLVGSPLYMAPEQARGDDIDHRADMYSLGCAFFHLVAGAPPYDGPSGLAVVAKHMTLPVPRLRARAPKTPRSVAAIIERLMGKEPKDRFADYDALIAALERAAPKAIARAGLSTRAAAAGIDGVIAATWIALIGAPGLFVHLLYVIIGDAYFGQTIGKYLMRIEVKALDGGNISVQRSAARTVVAMWLPLLVGMVILLTQGRAHLAQVIDRMQPGELSDFKSVVVAFVVSNVLLSVLYASGFVFAAFHPQKRAIHDLLGGAEVVYRFDDDTPTAR